GPRIISCGQTGIVYSVPTDTAASSYVWSVPTGAVIVADNGNSITVDFPAGAQTGDICVTAVNACGSSDPLCRTILVGGLYTRRIRGPQEVCRTDSSVTYYIPQVAGAVSYNWTIGGNAGMTVSGNNVTINFSSCTLNWVVLRVEVTNACGDVRSRSLWIHVRDCNGGGHDDDDDDDDDDDGDGHHGDDDRLLSPFANVTASLELQVFPNPSAGLFMVAVPEGNAGTVRVTVVDLSGKELYRAEQTLDAGSQQLQIDGNAFAPGVYFLRVEQDGAVGNERIIIAR
ncbi:MAG: T9SS type A sorting domain-containing protein, partial [Bacteroidota bacterium]